MGEAVDQKDLILVSGMVHPIITEPLIGGQLRHVVIAEGPNSLTPIFLHNIRFRVRTAYFGI